MNRKFKNILLVSNMYPNEENPSFGIFVKNTMDILQEEDELCIDKLVIYKSKNNIEKIWRYIVHYCLIVTKILVSHFDIVYVHYASHNAIPILITKFLKRNIVIYTNVHGSDIVPETKLQERLQYFVKKLIHKSSLVIVPSEYFKQLVSTKYGLIKNISIFPSGGLDTQIFKPYGCTPEDLGLSSRFKYLGYVGRIDYGKGWDDLINAFKDLAQIDCYNNLKLIIVGNGKEYKSLLEMIDRYKLNQRVILFDLLPQDELRKVYNIIELLVFPTRRIGESLGLVGLEAMACGTLVLGSNIGGLKSYIKHTENGLLFSPGNVEELKEKLIQFLEYSVENINKMKNNALETTACFDKKLVRKNFISVFK